MLRWREALSSVDGFVVIFILLMTGVAASLTIMDSEQTVWNAQDRARQVHASQQAEHLTLSLNGTRLSVLNDGPAPSSLSYLFQKGPTTSSDRRLSGSPQAGSGTTIPVTSGMLSFAITTSLGNVFWASNSTQALIAASTVPVTFDAPGLDPSVGSPTILTVDGNAYTYSSMPKTFEWAPGSAHEYAYTEGFSTGAGSRVGWSYARGLFSTVSGTVTAQQSGNVVSTYTQQYQLTASAAGGGVQYVNSPSGDGWYDAGSTVSISALAQDPFSFASWSTSDPDLLGVASPFSASTSISLNTYGVVSASFQVGQ